jgi:hypothetical protein
MPGDSASDLQWLFPETGGFEMSDNETTAVAEAPAATPEKVKKPAKVTLKVSEKGALSVYGLGRFPVTLYKEQWTKLLGMAEEIRGFLRDNDARLKTKGQTTE